jgi:hypothetical protein
MKVASLWGRKPFLAVRAFGRDGHYPKFSIRTSQHIFEPTPGLVWSAVIQHPLPEDWEIGEFTPLLPEEVRLQASLALCEQNPWANPWPVLTNYGSLHLELPGSLSDFRSDELYRHALELASSIGPGSLGPFNRDRTEYEILSYGSGTDASLLLQAIDTNDQLLLAGLARLLGAQRLLYMHEPEEAAIILFISMGAALEFIRLHLEHEAGGTDVPFSKVYDYFRATFPDGEGIADYFSERYDERLMAVHPSNRMGEFWAPPLMMSGVYHLRKSLMCLYRHILLGDPAI